MKQKDPLPGQKKADVMEQLSGVLDCVLDRTARSRGERERERLWREVIAARFEALKGLRRIADNLDLNSQSPGLNLGPFLYEVAHNVRCHLLQVQSECS
jgi:hypothetical protein